MQVTFSESDLGPLVQRVVREVLDQRDAAAAKVNGRLGYPEGEAAALLGIERHVLRDCRLRGEIHARKVGRGYVYSAAALQKFLESTD